MLVRKDARNTSADYNNLKYASYMPIFFAIINYIVST